VPALDEGGKFTLVMFWAKYLKDNCFPMLLAGNGFLKDPAFRDKIRIVAVATDPKEDQVQRFIDKAACPCDFPLAFDEGWKVKNAYTDVTGMSSMLAPQVFVVTPNGKIAWREAFSKGHPYEKTDFPEQLRRIVNGEEIISYGPSPLVDESESDEEVAVATYEVNENGEKIMTDDMFKNLPGGHDDCW